MSIFVILTNRTHQLRLLIIVISIVVTLSFHHSPTCSQTVTRDKFLWPFSSKSPWNMPIGSKARYIRANIERAENIGIDEEYFYKINPKNPLRPVYAPGAWGQGRCTGTQSMNIYLPIPDTLIIPDATQYPYYTPNNASAFLMPDGKTLVQLEPLTRCQKGGSIYGWRYFPDINIYGDGIGGAHFGSGLSSIGGSIRKGELTNNQPIRHALKVLLWAKKYLYYTNSIPGYRWPANRADNYAARVYGGKNPALVQGTLLAIAPTLRTYNLNLQTAAAKKIFHALQDYGAYVVDDSAWDSHDIAVEQGVNQEFRQIYGYNLNDKSGKFYQELMRLFQALSIVDNNSSNSIGGGGILRVALAPPIGN
ncbi:hypothetical protein FACHB389_36195 [Nostoc calcicola FACHB-389]|nr:hypothetical protein [Nostoc calcicola FACHB-3891]OKH13169.1 hypothetical protein FACHB389_36195 [Nostoc calcicola FACHB-389]